MAKKAPPPKWDSLDSYLAKVKLRVNDLEAQAKDLTKTSSQKVTDVQRIRSSLKSELEELHLKVRVMKKQVEEFKREIRMMTKEFKDLGKDDQFKKLQDKIDEWGPENFITKTELRRELENL